jgi:hypothetical protein
MTVIGRLDGQVDAVLIEPLKRRREPGAVETTDEKAQVESATKPQHETTEARARSAKTEGPRAVDVDLPVWLL